MNHRTTAPVKAGPFSLACQTEAIHSATRELFGVRYVRMQDTIAGKFLPRALVAVADEPGTMLDNLGRAKRLGWIASEAFTFNNMLV